MERVRGGVGMEGTVAGAGGLVVTSNQRLARELRREFDEARRAAGETVWAPAEALSWETWTAGMWRELLLEGRVRAIPLNRSQELWIWRAVLAEDMPAMGEAARAGMAATAADAWRTLWAYGAGSRLGSYEGSADTAAFRRWARAFGRRCRAGGYVSRAALEEALRLEVEAAGLPERMVGSGGWRVEMAGFDEVLPARRALLEALRRAGVEAVERAMPRARDEEDGGRRRLVRAGDELAETEACARWVRRWLEGRPGARVGVIVPELAGRRAALDRAFRRILAPELESLEAGPDAGGPYEFSLGVEMGRVPAVMAATDLLRWAAGPVAMGRVSGLVLSGFLGGGGAALEAGARAAFDAYGLRAQERLRPEAGVAEVERELRGSKWAAEAPALGEALRDLAAVAQRMAGEGAAEYAVWAERMAEVLGAARWAEGVGRGSVAFQVRQRWEGVLDELRTMDFAGVPVLYGDALREVERMVAETIFAPESRGAAVQVMGPMEAAGSAFDAVWFLGAGDAGWPARPAGQPLLPWGLQREFGMPGADRGADAERGRAVTERVAGSAPEVIFSYSERTEEPGRQRASAALAGMGLVEETLEEVAGDRTAAAVVGLESFADQERTPWPTDAVVRGGAAVLEAQAACGFRAFAQVRLAAREIPAGELGWDARTRGTVVHRVLELFWKEVSTQETLLAMSAEERRASVRRQIEAALGEAGRAGAGDEAGGWDRAYLGVQRRRLERLLGDWLEVEAGRAPFQVLRSELQMKDVRVGPLRMEVRVDRVDETEFGDVLIDYKTGEAKPRDWVGDRPDRPQLPIYAVLASGERELEGVAYGSVRAGKEMKMEGYAAHTESLPRVVRHEFGHDLAAQTEAWRGVLTRLAEEFAEGDTRVNPKAYPRTCKFCAARILCRLDASLLEIEDADEEEEEEDGETGGTDVG